jgi:flavin reductase (DIM6/NTAB) family NADH-FMN oxidoreductase RutF
VFEENPLKDLVSLDLGAGLWDRAFAVAPLVLVGTREPDGSYDLAPKHRVIPISDSYFCFVCSPSHATYRNAVRENTFTVSWPRPRQIVMASAAAAPRCEDGEKRTLRALPTLPAKSVEGVLVQGAYLFVECMLDRIIDLDGDELLIGRIVAAHADPDALRDHDVPDAKMVHAEPLLAYLHPGQFATIDQSTGFPFPKGFEFDRD